MTGPIDTRSPARAAATKPNYLFAVDHPNDVPRLAAAETEAGAVIPTELGGLRTYLKGLTPAARTAQLAAFDAQGTPAATRIAAKMRLPGVLS